MSYYFIPVLYINSNSLIEIFKVLAISIDGSYSYQGVPWRNLYLKYGKVIATSFIPPYTHVKSWFIWNSLTVYWNPRLVLTALEAWRALIFSTSPWTKYPLRIWYPVALYSRGWHWWTLMVLPVLISMLQTSFSLMLEVFLKMSVSRRPSIWLLSLSVCMWTLELKEILLLAVPAIWSSFLLAYLIFKGLKCRAFSWRYDVFIIKLLEEPDPSPHIRSPISFRLSLGGSWGMDSDIIITKIFRKAWWPFDALLFWPYDSSLFCIGS